MPELNPYAPPSSDLDPRTGPDSGSGNAVRIGDVVRVPAFGSQMPDRCVVCNAPAGGFKLKRTFYWHHQAIYILLFVAALLYIIVALLVRKRAIVSFGLCEKHRVRRRNALILALGGLGLGLMLSIAGANSTSSEIIFVGLAVLVILPITGALLARTAQPTRIDDQWAWLKVGRPFLESLPRGD
jgi:hypothetical protein